MLCFYAAQATHNPNVGTFVGGLALASVGSPMAIPMLTAQPRTELYPAVRQGLWLEGGKENPYVVVGANSSRKVIKVDPAVWSMPGAVLDEAPGKFYPKLLRATPSLVGKDLILLPETEDDGHALLILKAGYGNGKLLSYAVDNGETILESEGDEEPWIIASVEVGGTVQARRRTPSKLRFIGGRENKFFEEIMFTFDGSRFDMSMVTDGTIHK